MNSKTTFAAGIKAALLIALAGNAGGCISWHSGTAREFDPFPPATVQLKEQPPKRMNVNIAFHSEVRPLLQQEKDLIEEELSKYAGAVFEEVDYFRWNDGDPTRGDYTLNVNIVNSGCLACGIISGVITGITLTVIPGYAADHFKVVATLKNKAGNVLGKYEINQTSSTLFQLFMVFGMPFAYPKKVSEQMWHQIFGDVLVWSHEVIEGGTPGTTPPG